MTESDATPIRYRVDLGRHVHHLVDVTVTIPADLVRGARISLPVWTPGSYVVRDYVRHVERIRAATASGEPVDLTQIGRSSWQVVPPDINDDDNDDDGADQGSGQDREVEVTLELYANELTVRTNHVDDHHALLVAAATFPYIHQGTNRLHEVRLITPDGWKVWSLLDRGDDASFVADDYDHLIDNAFEAGEHTEVGYEVADVDHRFVWAGHGGRPDLETIADEAAAIGEAAVNLFGGALPVDRYTLLCEAWSGGRGGLEHRDGAVLAVGVHDLAAPDTKARFSSLIAHEYLHLWNAKRLVPNALVSPDYQRSVHSPSLWIAEGWTSYYDELLPLRAGVWDLDRYLDKAAEHVRSVLNRPGRKVQSVRQASYEAWTKYYVRDENTPNATVSYYAHGAVLAWCLDLLIRGERPDSDGLDEVMRLLWDRFGASSVSGASGYTESDVEAAAAEIAGRDLGDFFDAHVDGTATPPLEELVEVVGLRLTRASGDDDPHPPDLGVKTRGDGDDIVLESVLRGRPAWEAGLTGGDRLLAIDGVRVPSDQLDKALLGYETGDRIEVTVFRGPRLTSASVTLGDPRPDRELEPVDEPTDRQRATFRRWTGQDLSLDD